MASGLIKKHSIVLIQPEANKNSKTYLEYETSTAAVVGVLDIFEKKLRQLNPNLTTITYEFKDFAAYVDAIPDLSALVYDPNTKKYDPHDREWFKTRALAYLRMQGQQAKQSRQPSKLAQARPGGAALRSAPPQMKRAGKTGSGKPFKPSGRGGGNGAGRQSGVQQGDDDVPYGAPAPRRGGKRGGRGGRR